MKAVKNVLLTSFYYLAFTIFFASSPALVLGVLVGLISTAEWGMFTAGVVFSLVWVELLFARKGKWLP